MKRKVGKKDPDLPVLQHFVDVVHGSDAKFSREPTIRLRDDDTFHA